MQIFFQINYVPKLRKQILIDQSQSWLPSTSFLFSTETTNIRGHPGKILPLDKKTTPFSPCSSSFLFGVLTQGGAVAAILQPCRESLRSDGSGSGGALNVRKNLGPGWDHWATKSSLNHPPPEVLFSTLWLLILSHVWSSLMLLVVNHVLRDTVLLWEWN